MGHGAVYFGPGPTRHIGNPTQPVVYRYVKLLTRPDSQSERKQSGAFVITARKTDHFTHTVRYVSNQMQILPP